MHSDNIVADAARRLLQDFCDPQSVNNKADSAWAEPAWNALEEAGLTVTWVAEDYGGAGAGIADGFGVLREAGRFALALPLAETLLAAWLLERAGISSPQGPMACAPARDGDLPKLGKDGKLTGRLRAVPFAKSARHLAVLARRDGGRHAVALLDASALRMAEGTNIAGDPLNTVTLDGASPIEVNDAPAGLDADAVLLMGAAARTMQMAGALERILDMATTYAGERVAFERPIAKFQAVQQNLARLAGETAVAIAAAGSAAETIAAAGKDNQADRYAIFLEVAAAKIRVGEAAGEGAAIAHQVLGAIGFTREHILHRYTRRLWAWRDEFGNETFWAVKLGNLVAAQGADALWPMLAAR
jgi:alkylation response protein AidB-like acyl-CoA dehydrogenase